MRLSLANCLLVPSMSLGVIVNAASDSLLEVDLVFPRNKTYAPTERFPVVFAFQNAERAKYLNPHISYTIRNWADLGGNDSVSWPHDLRTANWSSHEPYFAYNYFSDRFATEGHWLLTWTVSWQSCNEQAFSRNIHDGMISNISSRSTSFTIKDSAHEVDLVSATADKATCPVGSGIAINVPGKTMDVPWWVDWSGGDTCAVVASSTPTPTPDPCRVTIDSAAEASMSASWTARLCNGTNPPPDCPKDDEGAAQRLAVIGESSFFAVFGALGVLLSL